MPPRYLFGPVTADFAEQNLKQFRQRAECFAFNEAGTTDIKIDPFDNWETVLSQLPSAQPPDFIVLSLDHTHIPAFLWSAPVPLVGWAGDWKLHWHYYRRRLPDCELIWSDAQGVEVLERESIPEARIADLNHLALINQELPQMQERVGHRKKKDPIEELITRTWQLLGTRGGSDPQLARDLALALIRSPQQGILHNALGLVICFGEANQVPIPANLAQQSVGHFQRAVDCAPENLAYRLNLTEALVALNQTNPAVDLARKSLTLLDQMEVIAPGFLEAGHFPPIYDPFRVEWERAAWTNAGSRRDETHAKLELIRWRFHILLAELTQDLAHYYEAVLARPDLPLTRAALGCALGRRGRFREALPHLRRAVTDNPFDLPAARALSQALGDVGETQQQQRLAQERRQLSQAAPHLVPPESWFINAPPVPESSSKNLFLPEKTDAAIPSRPPFPNIVQAKTPQAKIFRISLCLIVKNEESNLPACLGSASGLFDEVIVVDTGSIDRTKELAHQSGARVFDFPWVDSFAAARNESLRHAAGDWIFWLDADDRIDADNRSKIRQLFANLKDENAAFVMKCVCLPDPNTSSSTVVDHVRFFRNRPDIRWRYRVHEQILPAIRETNGIVYQTEIAIHHVGYQDPHLRGRKQARDLRLLQLDQADRPDDPFTLFNLGWAFLEQGNPAEALPLLGRSLERSHPADSIVRKLFALIMECHRHLGNRAEAFKVCREGRRFYPDDAQLLFQEAVLRNEEADPLGAEACLLRLLGTAEGPHFASVAEGLRGYKARHLLAMIYQKMGRLAEAEAQWRGAVGDRLDFIPGWAGLGEIFLVQKRWNDLEELLKILESQGGRPCHFLAAKIRERGLLAQRDPLSPLVTVAAGQW